MALADFLSAMRVLILDGPALPEAAAERRRSLAERFPRLSQMEIDDLATLPPDRLQVYSDLVFGGERSMLRWAFPMTFAAIQAIDPSTDLARLVRDLHHHRTWHSASSRELARIFQAYLIEDRRDLIERWPGLADLADYERTDLEVFYAADVPYAPWNSDEESRLRALSVEALLNQRVFRPTYAAVREFSVDVLVIVDQWRASQSLPTPLPPPTKGSAACGRAPANLMPAWVRLTPAGLAALSAVNPDVPTCLNDLAGRYVESVAVSPSLSEERIFADFYADLTRWLSAGVLLRVPEDR
ncbi:MAG TPA: hypothetical protein VJZ71_00715 [Phycisphaerae bacterium]|nr:hypothetical protein [Phycisphaerae bacterium]